MFLNIGSIVDTIPLFLYPCGEVCEEEAQKLQRKSTDIFTECTITERLFAVSLQHTDVLRHFVSYCVHLLDIQRFDNVAEMLRPNLIKDKSGEVANN